MFAAALPALLLALAAAQIAARVAGRPTLSARLLPRAGERGASPFGVWALRLWPAFGLPALLALGLIGRVDAPWRMPPEFAAAAVPLRALGRVDAGPILLGLLLGSGLSALLSRRRVGRGGRIGYLGRPPRLPASGRELPAAALLALSAGVAEELYFRLALPLLVTLVFGSAIAGFLVAAAAFGAVHRYQGPVGVVATGAAGLFLGGVYLASGLFWLAVACHVAIDFNALVIRPWLAFGGRRDA